MRAELIGCSLDEIRSMQQAVVDGRCHQVEMSKMKLTCKRFYEALTSIETNSAEERVRQVVTCLKACRP